MVKQLVQMETLFKALADATRLRILGLLLAGEAESRVGAWSVQ